MDQTAYDMTLPEALDVARTPSECEESDVLAALSILGRRVAALLEHCDQIDRDGHSPIVATFGTAAIRAFLEQDPNPHDDL